MPTYLPTADKTNAPKRSAIKKEHKRDTVLLGLRVEDALSLVSTVSVLAVGFIFLFILIEGAPAFFEIGPFNLILGTAWNPTYHPPEFGTLPLTIASLMVTFGSLALSVPMGLMCAIYIAEIADPRTKDILKSTAELLAGIPSVVYGFFGVIIIIPWIRGFFGIPAGETALAGAVVLSIMVLPTIVSISEDAITSIPREYREASLALGATRWQTIHRVVLPAASSGVGAAVILGFGRAIGETMAVLMLTGGSALIPKPIYNFLSPVRTMTGTIAAEMGEASLGSTHYHVLFSIGILLFTITLIANTVGGRLFRESTRR